MNGKIQHDSKAELLSELNPFSPGAGRRPAALVGRQGELERMDYILARTKMGKLGQGIIYTGLRGVGKTVLLLSMESMAKAMRMPTLRIEATGDDDDDYTALFQGLATIGKSVNDRHFLKSLPAVFDNVKSMSVNVLGNGFAIGMDNAKESATERSNAFQFEALVENIAQNASRSNLGLFMFIDELQEMSPKLLRILITTQHRMGQQNLPFYIIAAGLPNLPRVLTKARSYAERLFDYRSIDRLSEKDTAAGFQETVATEGRSFSDSALARLVKDSQGYPYFIQTYGEAAWNQSESSPIPLEAVRRGEPIARRSLDEGLYASRWQRATPAGRAYLAAMASLSDSDEGAKGCDSSQVAALMHKSTNELSNTRGRLIEFGLIYSPEHGKIAFTVPGMADFIRRVDPSETQAYEGEASAN